MSPENPACEGIPDLDEARRAAIDAAAAAREVIAGFLASGEWSEAVKSDDSPVTEVDIASEEAIHAVLARACPRFAFFGEETGSSASEAEAGAPCWLVDPIDGTKSFVRRMPYWSIQIALEASGEYVLGVSTAPLWDQQVVAVKGQGVFLNGEPVKVRDSIRSLDQAFLSSGNLKTLASRDDAWMRYGALVRRVRRTRGYGDFSHYHQLICGQADLVIESDVNILDIAALTVAVREAGGVITDLGGREIDRETTSVLAAGTPELHAEALESLRF